MRARSLGPLAAFRERVGLPLPPPLCADRIAQATLPVRIGGRLWEDTALATGDAAVAFRVAAASCVTDMPLGRLAGSARTLGEALCTAARASSHFCAQQRLWLTQVGKDVWVQRRFPDELQRGRREANDFALLMLLDLVRRGAGAAWRPTELHLEGPPPAHAEELAALAAGSVCFGATADTVVFPHELLGLPLPRAHPLPSETPLPPASDFPASVRQAAGVLLQMGELTLPNLADVAGTSVRTLQRHLAASGSSFARVVDEARYEAASRLLRSPGLRITDVAVELGYSDSANFTRAFRRWAGVSPLGFRRAVEAK